MFLPQVEHVNRLSDGFRKKLEAHLNALPRLVTYKFFIGTDNPDPEKKDGAVVFREAFTLPERTFSIIENGESKLVGLRPSFRVLETTGVKQFMFDKIQIKKREHLGGLITYDQEIPEQKDNVAYLEIHPRNRVEFSTGAYRPGLIFERVNIKKITEENRTKRDDRFKAMAIAKDLSEEEVRTFIAALESDDTLDIGELRDVVEELAENDPTTFIKQYNADDFHVRALIKRAMTAQIIQYDPGEGRMFSVGNNNTLAVLDTLQGSQKSPVELMAQWIIHSKDGPKVKKLLQHQLPQ
jgi:hypothetical protein